MKLPGGHMGRMGGLWVTQHNRSLPKAGQGDPTSPGRWWKMADLIIYGRWRFLAKLTEQRPCQN